MMTKQGFIEKQHAWNQNSVLIALVWLVGCGAILGGFIFYSQHTAVHGGPPSPAASTNKEAQFVAEARTAFKKHDVDRLMSLYCWDGVLDETKAATRQAILEDMRGAVIDVTLTDPDPRWTVRVWKGNLVTYVVNLPVTKNLNVKLKPQKGDGPGVEYHMKPYNVGEKDGKLYLLSAAPGK